MPDNLDSTTTDRHQALWNFLPVKSLSGHSYSPSNTDTHERSYISTLNKHQPSSSPVSHLGYFVVGLGSLLHSFNLLFQFPQNILDIIYPWQVSTHQAFEQMACLQHKMIKKKVNSLEHSCILTHGGRATHKMFKIKTHLVVQSFARDQQILQNITLLINITCNNVLLKFEHWTHICVSKLGHQWFR